MGKRINNKFIGAYLPDKKAVAEAGIEPARE